MPLTRKGRVIRRALDKEYGPDKGEKVFYAMRNAKKIRGVDPESSSVDINKTKTMLKLEASLVDRWNSLTSRERQVYLTALGDASTFHQHTTTAPASPQHKTKLDALNHHLESLPHHIKHKFNRLSENAKNGIADWHSKTPEQRTQDVKHALHHVAKNFVHHTVHHLKHEAQTYKHAGEAVGHLMRGKKWGDLHEHHKKGLRNALVHAGITAGSMAMGDATGSIGHLAASFAMEHAHHAALLGAGHVIGKTGHDIAKHATAAEKLDKPKKSKQEIEREAQKFVDALIKADLPAEEWIKIVHEVERKRKYERYALSKMLSLEKSAIDQWQLLSSDEHKVYTTVVQNSKFVSLSTESVPLHLREGNPYPHSSTLHYNLQDYHENKAARHSNNYPLASVHRRAAKLHGEAADALYHRRKNGRALSNKAHNFSRKNRLR